MFFFFVFTRTSIIQMSGLASLGKKTAAFGNRLRERRSSGSIFISTYRPQVRIAKINSLRKLSSEMPSFTKSKSCSKSFLEWRLNDHAVIFLNIDISFPLSLSNFRFNSYLEKKHRHHHDRERERASEKEKGQFVP